MREDLQKQFSSDSESNPLAGFQKAALAAMRDSSKLQAEHLRLMDEKLAGLREEVVKLQAEREKLAELDAEREKGTAKGRSFEEAVAEALDTLAVTRGDVCEAVGDVRGEGGKKGDVVIDIDACAGAPRGRIVFEAKDRKLSRNGAIAELDGALRDRAADYAVLVVPSDDELPAKSNPLREFNGDKLFVVFDPEEGPLALEVAYSLARARVLMSRGEDEGLDPDAIRAEIERAEGAMQDVRRIKSQLTNARTGIDNAQEILDAMAGIVRGHLAQIGTLLAAAEPDADDA